MLKRFIVVLALLSMPLAARADDTTSPAPTDPTQTSSDSPQSGDASASSLGPSAVGADSGGSNADASSLQPAGGSPLQSTTNDSTGLTAPTSSALQAPATGNDTLKVILGDGDGPTHEVATASPSYWGWLWFSLLIGLVVTSVSLILPKRYQPRIRLPKRK